jgi:tetratricopeptide (TPR) repeat protein
MNKSITLLILLLVFSFNLRAQTSYEIFKNGNKFYEEKAYDSAKTYYNKLYNQGTISKELFLNLGNSYFKLDSLPNAILFFEKGLKISPGDIDLTHNLQHCNTLLKDKNSIKKSILLNELVYSFLGKSPNYWAYSSIVLLLLACILFLFYRISTNSSWKRINFYSSIIVLIIFGFSLILSAISKSKIKESKYGIIFNPTTKVLVEPSNSAATTYQLHEGSKVKVTAENKNWYEISFNEKKGWIIKKHLKKI